ncbi:MAG: hypothetical protein R3348_04715 [Xanthomonadales bacterium]|nr:hypothetical protein [Xanthomonadales bacterium]
MSDPESRRTELSELRHSLNNGLNVISMEAELALHHMENDDLESARQSLRDIILKCRQLSRETVEALAD